jgi:feruloyl esterase
VIRVGRRNRRVTGLSPCLAWVLAGVLSGTAPAALAKECGELVRLAMPEVRITAATAITENSGFMPPVANARAPARDFCRVEGVIEKEIGFELWLPDPARWNGKLLTGGVGGQAGNFNYRELVRGVRRGYASASTDTGHKASDRHWLLGDPARAQNYAHRANHLLAVKGKAIIEAYYGRAPSHAYFVGCSGGGRQALTQAQRYPGDYDGIIAGAPGPKTPEMSARRLWEMQQHSQHAARMDASRWRLIARAGVAACDRHDGLEDGMADDPRSCPFDIASLRCSAERREACLDGPQIELARRIYAPLHDENGKRIDDGLLPGVPVRPELLPEPFTPGAPYLAVALFGDGVHRDPNWDPRHFRIARDLPAIDRVMDLHADNPDLSAFEASGGKLIVYQGWADPLVAAQPTVEYFETVERRMGGRDRTSRFARLYMGPGMDHCIGGTGPDRFGGAGDDAPVVDARHDLLSALEEWVERGAAPSHVVASQLVDGKVVRTRPLCPFPQRARHLGIGSVEEAASFVCR